MQVSTHSAAIVFSQATTVYQFEQSILTFFLSTEHYLQSQPQRRQESNGFIDLFTVYYAAAT